MTYNSTLNDYEKICSSCTIHIVLFVIFFLKCVSISSIFIYFNWYLKRKYIETKTYWMQFHWTYKWELLCRSILKIVHITFKDFHSSLLKLDKKPYKNISIYNNGYVTIKTFDAYESIISVSPLYLIIGKADGYIKENIGNKYLVFNSTDDNEKVLVKFTQRCNEIKQLIQTLNEGKKRWVWKIFYEN